jgi:hypothetical protein
VTISAIGDSYIENESPAATHGSDTELHVDGNSSKVRRLLVQFGITSTVPAGSTIQSASLRLCYPVNPSAGAQGHVHELFRVSSSWTENVVSWNTRPSNVAGATASLTVPASSQCRALDVTADVQAWSAGTSDFGWLLKDQAEGGGGSDARYASREHGTAAARPALTITYVPAPTTVTLSSLHDTYVGANSPGSGHGSEATLHVDPVASGIERALLQFDVLNTVPPNADIESAELTVCMTNILTLAAGRTHNLHQITTGWSEGSASWSNMPGFAAAITDSINVPLFTGCTTLDVTADVEAWVSGQPTHGWLIKDSNEGAGTLTGVEYASREHGSAASRPQLKITYTP